MVEGKEDKCRDMLVGILATELTGMRELCREIHHLTNCQSQLDALINELAS